ncbi:NgrE [Xenorhabdus miraniensis]|uniref:NgrE n=2 Tax=Xenorhabdus miraniensis TaxID=351674 RepID=A0A2D0JS53_9GAMM|nr:NgrE [Xenorhabdus miraniensis]
MAPAIVRGTGTKFKSNLNGVAPGQAIIIQPGNSNLLHMIQAVNSDTELVLANAVKTTLNNVTYQIQITIPDSVSDTGEPPHRFNNQRGKLVDSYWLVWRRWHWR